MYFDELSANMIFTRSLNTELLILGAVRLPMKKLLLPFLFLLSIQSVFAQHGFLSRFINKMYFNKDTSKHSSFVLVPALSSAPETGLEIGGAALFSFYSDTISHITNVSNLFGYSTVTTKGQVKLSLNANYWTPRNRVHYIVNTSFYSFPFYFYGIGNNTRLADQDLIDEKRYKYSFESDFNLGSHMYLGYVLGAFKYFYKYDKNRFGILNTSPLVEDKKGGAAVSIGPSFTYDSRNNNTYTTRGIIINAYYNLMHGAFINSNYKGGFFNIEYSGFVPLGEKFVWGTDIQEQSLTGASSPFYLLPQMGSDEIMRGYYGGRFRDRNYIAGQTELRYRLTRRFGLAAFAGAGEVFHSDFSFSQLKPNYGGGLRYFFDVEKGLAIRMDYGIGQKPPGEPRISGLYVALGQSF